MAERPKPAEALLHRRLGHVEAGLLGDQEALGERRRLGRAHQVDRHLVGGAGADATCGLELAAETGQAVPTCEAATRVFERAIAAGLGEKNSSVVIKTVS